MSRQTEGHSPFSLKFNRGKAFRNPPLKYSPQLWSVRLDFFLPPKPHMYIWKNTVLAGLEERFKIRRGTECPGAPEDASLTKEPPM